MKATLTIILIMAVMLIAGCQIQKESGCAAPMKVLGGECCLDNNDNNVCDKAESVKQENSAVVISEKATVDKRITEVLANQAKLNNEYHYVKQYFDIKDTSKATSSFEQWRKGNKTRQEYSLRVFYREGQGKLYEYFKRGNRSEVVSLSWLKNDDYLISVDQMISPEIINYNYTQQVDGMLIKYNDTQGNIYQTYVWKYYGIPIEIKKTSPSGQITLIKYTDTLTKVSDKDVTLPTGESMS